MKIRKQYTPEVVLTNWRDLLQALPNMNEAELEAALKTEVARPKEDRRADFIKRIYTRYNRLRAERELAECMP